jgi:hypothetical protein
MSPPETAGRLHPTTNKANTKTNTNVILRIIEAAPFLPIDGLDVQRSQVTGFTNNLSFSDVSEKRKRLFEHDV